MYYLKKALSKYKISEWCFVALLLLAVVYMSIICYCDTISGDEYFSAGFANNTKGFLFLSLDTIDKFGNEGWIEGEFLRDYLSVQEGEGFSILGIHRNIRSDVHPPLYFMLLNMLSSFFVDEIPYFAGFLINIVSGVVICIVLYLLGRKMFQNHWLALAPPMVWIGSEGTRTSIVYLRMYAPLCALCLICIYLHILLFEKEKNNKWIYIALAVCTTIGTLTHYYFYIMLIVVGLISTVRLFYRRKYQKFLMYAISHGGGWIVSYMAYPYVFKHLLFSERGTEVQDNLKNMDSNYYRDFFGEFMQTINNSVYNNRFITIVCIFIILVVLSIVVTWSRKRRNIAPVYTGIFTGNDAKINLILLGGYAVGYFLILFKISYSAQWLYISPIFTLLTFVTVGVFARILEKIFTQKYVLVILVVSVVAMIGSTNIRVEQAFDRYEKRESRHRAITAYSDTCDVLFYYTDWNNLYNNQMQELMEFNQIYSIDINDIETTDYEAVLHARDIQQDIVAYIPIETEGYEKKAIELAQKIGNGTAELILEDKFAIYYLAIE